MNPSPSPVLNWVPPPYQGGALPSELLGLVFQELGAQDSNLNYGGQNPAGSPGYPTAHREPPTGAVPVEQSLQGTVGRWPEGEVMTVLFGPELALSYRGLGAPRPGSPHRDLRPCPRRDLNPHAPCEAPASQAGESTYSVHPDMKTGSGTRTRNPGLGIPRRQRIPIPSCLPYEPRPRIELGTSRLRGGRIFRLCYRGVDAF